MLKSHSKPMMFLYALLAFAGCRTSDKMDSSDINSFPDDQKCPWKTSNDLIVLPEAFGQMDPEKILSQVEIVQDLQCLGELFKKQYAAVEYYKNLDPNISLLDRVQNFAANATSMSNYQLMPQLFNAIHKDAYDGHLNYWLNGDPSKGRDPISNISQPLVPYIIVGKATKSTAGDVSLIVK